MEKMIKEQAEAKEDEAVAEVSKIIVSLIVEPFRSR